MAWERKILYRKDIFETVLMDIVFKEGKGKVNYNLSVIKLCKIVNWKSVHVLIYSIKKLREIENFHS